VSRLNSLTLTLIDAPDGAVGYEVEHYTPPKPPFTPAESLMMHLLYTIEQVNSDEDHSEDETNNGPPSESLCTGLQRGQGGTLGLVGGDNVVVIGSRTERSRGIVETDQGESK
jgi:hypothetical protein